MHATLGQRFIGRLIDNFVMLVPGLIVGALLSSAIEDPEETMLPFFIGFALGALPGLIATWVLIALRDKSIGKLLMRTHLARADGRGRVGFVRGVIAREWVISLLGLVPVVGRLVGLVDGLAVLRPSRRTVHDEIAGTVVLQDGTTLDGADRADVFS